MGVGGGTVVPALGGRGTGWEGKETEEWPGKWSAVSTALPPLAAATVAAATVPAAWHKCCMGHYRESVPSPCPLGGEGEGRESHQLGEGGGGVGK